MSTWIRGTLNPETERVTIQRGRSTPVPHTIHGSLNDLITYFEDPLPNVSRPSFEKTCRSLLGALLSDDVYSNSRDNDRPKYVPVLPDGGPHGLFLGPESPSPTRKGYDLESRRVEPSVGEKNGNRGEVQLD